MTIHKRIKVEFPIPYSTRNLIAWYDGEWNAGLGLHDDHSLVDLSGNGQDMAIQSGSIEFGKNFFRATSPDAMLSAAPCRLLRHYDYTADTITAEFAVGPDTTVNGTIFGTALNPGYTCPMGFRFNAIGELSKCYASVGWNQFAIPSIKGSDTQNRTITFVKHPLANNEIPVAFYENGTLMETQSRFVGNANTIERLALLNCAGMNAFMGKFHSFRLYLGTHTVSEISANAAIDAERFFSH